MSRLARGKSSSRVHPEALLGAIKDEEMLADSTTPVPVTQDGRIEPVVWDGTGMVNDKVLHQKLLRAEKRLAVIERQIEDLKAGQAEPGQKLPRKVQTELIAVKNELIQLRGAEQALAAKLDETEMTKAESFQERVKTADNRASQLLLIPNIWQGQRGGFAARAAASPWLALALILFYFGIGLLYYSAGLGWFVVDTIYFSMTVVTTVGYGDQNAIVGNGQQIFTSFYVLFGVGMVAIQLSQILNWIVAKQEELHKKEAKEALQAYLKENKSAAGMEPPFSILGLAKKWPLTVNLLLFFVLMFVGIGAMASLENFGFVEGIYWFVVTGTTVGFGDFSPRTRGGRLFGIFYLIPVVLVTGSLFGRISALMAPASKGESSQGLTQELIARCDTDGDGSVSKAEWLSAMLVSSGCVDQDTIDDICDHFDSLDVNGDGGLSIHDLTAATNRSDAPGGASGAPAGSSMV